MIRAITATGSPAQFLQSFKRSTAQTQQSVERLSTGKRINRPSDDPSGFISAESLRREIVRLQGELKTIRGNRSATRVQQSGLSNLQDQLLSLKGLITGANGTVLSDEQRVSYEQEIADSLESIANLRKQLTKVPDPSAGSSPTAAAPVQQVINDLKPQDLASAATVVESGIDSVVFSRAAQAAYEKYNLDVQAELYENMIVIHSEALSQVEDADFAEEASKLALSQVMANGAMAALSLSGEINAEQIQALLDGASQPSLVSEQIQ